MKEMNRVRKRPVELSSFEATAFILRLTRSYFCSSARSTAICLSTIARLVPPIACRRSTLASKSNTLYMSSVKSLCSDLKSANVSSLI